MSPTTTAVDFVYHIGGSAGPTVSDLSKSTVAATAAFKVGNSGIDTTKSSKMIMSIPIKKKKVKATKKKRGKLHEIVIGESVTLTRDRRWTSYRNTAASAGSVRRKTGNNNNLKKKTTKTTAKAGTLPKKTVAHKKTTATISKRARQRRNKAFKKEVSALDSVFQNMQVGAN